MTPEFKEFAKIARLSRNAVITEKIDGTNASVTITEDNQFLTGSRTRWITPEDDNYGFSRWSHEHKEELMQLGVGSHFGEWWGQGIQRNYGLKEKRWSLFNVGRWVLHNETPTEKQKQLPKCCSLVPILYEGLFTTLAAEGALSTLQLHGSKAAPGFMKPEGIVIFHEAARTLFKKTLEKDSEPKSLSI